MHGGGAHRCQGEIARSRQEGAAIGNYLAGVNAVGLHPPSNRDTLKQAGVDVRVVKDAAHVNAREKSGYGYVGVVLQVKEQNGKFTAEVIQKYKPSQGLASEQQTPIYSNGHLFGIMPKDAGGFRNEFVCFHPDDCMEVVMRSGKTDRFGMGPYIIADDKFFILNDDGEMTIAKLSTNRFTVLDRAQIIDGQDSWGPIAITGGYLLMRDSKQLICINIKAD